MAQHSRPIPRLIQRRIPVIQQFLCRLRFRIQKHRQHIHLRIPEIVALISLAGESLCPHPCLSVASRRLENMKQVKAQPLYQRTALLPRYPDIRRLPEASQIFFLPPFQLLIPHLLRFRQLPRHKFFQLFLPPIQRCDVADHLFQYYRLLLCRLHLNHTACRKFPDFAGYSAPAVTSFSVYAPTASIRCIKRPTKSIFPHSHLSAICYTKLTIIFSSTDAPSTTDCRITPTITSFSAHTPPTAASCNTLLTAHIFQYNAMTAAAPHRQAAGLSSPLIVKPASFPPQLLRLQLSPEGPVIHDRIGLSCMVLHIPLQLRHKPDLPRKIKRRHLKPRRHNMLPVKGHQPLCPNPHHLSAGRHPHKPSLQKSLLHMQHSRILRDLPPLHIKLLPLHIQSRLLQIRQIQQGLTVERRTEIRLPVTDLLALIKPVHKITFQPGIHIKLISFLKGPPRADIPVRKRKRRLISVIRPPVEHPLRDSPFLHRINRFSPLFHLLTYPLTSNIIFQDLTSPG